ncbi:hypothetical protein E1202_25810 [Saccharopolyspora karakumensis]|uniref:Uncharacterized protein n=1 Tax=Saccharopolyspora karakumensis TaxID=2530386 RepID=A0A4R5BHS6_9PSEU|nr:hypothetical protein [Saccharopolyspora karakumensis]TDD83262.1 hypothetical protein E1202_25810 [Saccharopolyspora karakumensis]
MARIPCQWLFLGGFTFLWGRGDPAIDVLRGDTGRVHGNGRRVAVIPVDQSRKDVQGLQQRARAWLRVTAARRAGVRG